MCEYDALFEDENDIFSGTPKSKFMDVVKNANVKIVSDEIDKIIQKYAIMEILLCEGQNENFNINEVLNNYLLKNNEKVEKMKKSLYMEFTGDIIQRLDS